MGPDSAQPWHDVLVFWFPEGRNIGSGKCRQVRFPDLTARGAGHTAGIRAGCHRPETGADGDENRLL